MSCSISSIETSCSSRIAQDQVVELGAFARIEAGRRLVEAEQHRVGAHGARDLEPPLVAIGQVAGRIVGAAIRPIASSQCRAFSIASRSAAAIAAEAEHAEHA